MGSANWQLFKSKPHHQKSNAFLEKNVTAVHRATSFPVTEMLSEGQIFIETSIVKTSSVACLYFDESLNKEPTAFKAVSKLVYNFSFADIFKVKSRQLFTQFWFFFYKEVWASLGLLCVLCSCFYCSLDFPNSFFILGFQSCIIHKFCFASQKIEKLHQAFKSTHTL